MAKSVKKAKARRNNWKREATEIMELLKGAKATIEALELKQTQSDSELVGVKAELESAKAELDKAKEELGAVKAKLAEVEAGLSALETTNKDLVNRNFALESGFYGSRSKSRRLESRNRELRLEIDSRRRLAGVLAVFHHASTCTEDCLEEFAAAGRAVGVDIDKIDKAHVSEAYKAAGRRLHKLTWEKGIRMTKSHMSPQSATDSLEATINAVEQMLGMRDRV